MFVGAPACMKLLPQPPQEDGSQTISSNQRVSINSGRCPEDGCKSRRADLVILPRVAPYLCLTACVLPSSGSMAWGQSSTIAALRFWRRWCRAEVSATGRAPQSAARERLLLRQGCLACSAMCPTKSLIIAT